jgi:hypothetical protein
LIDCLIDWLVGWLVIFGNILLFDDYFERDRFSFSIGGFFSFIPFQMRVGDFLQD